MASTLFGIKGSFIALAETGSHSSDSTLSALNDVLPAMARTWSSRKVGLITRSVINHRSDYAQHLDQSVRRPILGVANPARLSSAEFRVCMLLSQGLSVAGVCSELSLAEATVRSHLRNIYAKSDSANLAELIFRLIGPETSLPTSHVMSA